MPEGPALPNGLFVEDGRHALDESIVVLDFPDDETFLFSLANLAADAGLDLAVPPIVIRLDGQYRDVFPFHMKREMRLHIGHPLPERQQIRRNFLRVLQCLDDRGGIPQILVPIIFEAHDRDRSATDGEYLAPDFDAANRGGLAANQRFLLKWGADKDGGRRRSGHQVRSYGSSIA